MAAIFSFSCRSPVLLSVIDFVLASFTSAQLRKNNKTNRKNNNKAIRFVWMMRKHTRNAEIKLAIVTNSIFARSNAAIPTLWTPTEAN